MHVEREVPVLIAGAGPAGLTTAITLARHGVESLLVERRQELSGLPRATAISTRSMELLRSFGVEDEILAGGNDVEWTGWSCRTLAAADDGAPFPLGLPTREQSALVSPTAPACVPQDHLEPVLLRRLATLGAARVRFGTELALLKNGADGVRVLLRDVGTGATQVVHARHLVAADGAHSAVRTRLGIRMHGPDDLAGAVTALFRAPLWELLGEHRHGLYDIANPVADIGGVFLPAGPGDRWIYGLPRDPEDQSPDDLTHTGVLRQIRRASGVPALQPRIERVGTFTFAAQLAERFRQGSTILVGDAAHRVTPRGGTGMNTAIQDGFDVGWKLAWVLRGWAAPALLDSYEAERRPVAEYNAARSADRSGSARTADEVLHADLGGRIPHLWLPGRVSTLDLLGTGLTLFTGPRREPWDAAADRIAGSPPLAVHALDAVTARALGIHGDGARLVRPDGAPAGWWPSAGEAVPGLRGAVTAAGYAAPNPPAQARLRRTASGR